jgi:type IV secretory pathway VirB10-like protein
MRIIRTGAFVLAAILSGSVMTSARAVREITIPAGTRLPIVLDTAVASNTSRAEQPVSGHVTKDVSVNGVVVVPAGSQVYGVVTDAPQREGQGTCSRGPPIQHPGLER